MKKAIPRKSIKAKILGIVLLSIFFITAVLGFLSFEFSKRRLVSMLGDSIKGIAATAATYIQEREVRLILMNLEKLKERHMAAISPVFSHVYDKTQEAEAPLPDQALNEAMLIYEKYMKFLSDVKTKNEIDSPINLYTVEGNRLKLVMTSDPVLLSGTVYIMRPKAEEAVSTGLAQSTGIYEDKDGMWISAYAPISADFGNAQTLVEVNYRINSYIDRLNRELGVIVLVCILGFLGTAVISYRLVTNLALKIKRLDDAADELKKERYDSPIDVKSDDEIGHLAETFEALRLSIREKIDELRLSLVREKRAHLESIVALTNAIEMRDPYTKEHLYRVEKYALLIVKKMHLDRSDVEKLKYACFLHDIGKIYTDSSLLSKIELSPSEFKEIRKHSERGAKIIEGIQFLTDVKDAVLYHQERYDGKGYPSGLKGKDIPLLARIIQVADAFDAMTTDRPYRQKMPFKEAVKEIEVNAGTQFDPEICDAFLSYKDEIEEIAKKHFEEENNKLS